MTPEPSYNGWKNYDTWKFNLNMSNSPEGQNYLTKNKTKLLKMNKLDMLKTIKKNVPWWDSVNLNKVSATEIKSSLKEY